MRGRVRETVLLVLLLAPVSLPAVEVGQIAPALTLASIRPDGAPILLSDYRGKAVYLDFWSAWCAPCRRTMPDLSALRDDLPRDRFEVVAINIDPVTENAVGVLANIPVSYPVGVDPILAAVASFGVSTLPAAFLIDRDGVVQRVYRGVDAGDIRTIRKDVQHLLNEPARLAKNQLALGRDAGAKQSSDGGGSGP